MDAVVATYPTRHAQCEAVLHLPNGICLDASMFEDDDLVATSDRLLPCQIAILQMKIRHGPLSERWHTWER